MSDPTPETDRRAMRRLAYVLLFGIVLTWTGLATDGKQRQEVGVLICLAAFVWIGFFGWRIMVRCATRMRDEM